MAAIARELLGRIGDLTMRINELEREITQLVRPLAPNLLAMPGCGPLSAAKNATATGAPQPARRKPIWKGWLGRRPWGGGRDSCRDRYRDRRWGYRRGY